MQINDQLYPQNCHHLVTMANSVPMIPNLEVPKGNWIARNLRLVNEDSKQLFPSSACASRGSKKDKFSTLYKVDFKDYPEGDYIE